MDADVSSVLDQVVSVLRDAPSMALAGHVTPDGDALGSMLAFRHLAAAAGHEVVASWPEPFVFGEHYRSVPGLDLAVPPSRFPAEPPVMLTFDCSSIARLNELAVPARWARDHGSLVVVDHHASNERFGSINLVDTSAAATAVVVREIARRMEWPLTYESACCLYTGLVTDTGRFQYEGTTPAVFALAEELCAFGLPIAQLSRELFEEHRFAYLQLASQALARAELDPVLRMVSTFVTIADRERFGVTYEEIEGLIDWVRTASEADVACVCKEADDGVRVSLRSVRSVDVGAIATRLGGGGHRLAAGFTMDAPVAEVLDAIKVLVREALGR